MASSCPHLDFNHRSSDVALNREDISKALRATPIFHTDAFGGYYVVTSHQLAKDVLRQSENFTTVKTNGEGGVTIPPAPFSFVPAEVDGPDHARLRRALNPLFSPQSLQKIRPVMEAAVQEAVASALARGEFDIVHDIAEPLPAKIILTYLGFDPEQARTVVNAGQSAMGTSADPDAAALGFARMKSVIEDLIAARTAEPKDDAVSYMIEQQVSPLTGTDLYWAVFTLAVGGIENVAALLENALLHIAQTPELRARLIAEPALVPQAVEEFLRYFTPGGGLARTALRDVEIGGVTLKAGDRIFAWLPSANKDESTFAESDTVNIDRTELTQHLSLGHGRHFCIGASLARMEIAYIIQQVLAAMPEYTVDVANAKRFENAGNMYGWWKMPAKVRP
jgi:cytochrome P450